MLLAQRLHALRQPLKPRRFSLNITELQHILQFAPSVQFVKSHGYGLGGRQYGLQESQANHRLMVLRLLDLDHSDLALLNALRSRASSRVCQYASNIAWYRSEPRLACNGDGGGSRMHLEVRGPYRSTGALRPCAGSPRGADARRQ